MRHREWLVSAALVLAAVHAACTSSSAAAPRADGRPTVLRYLFSPSAEEPFTQLPRLEKLSAYLERELGIPVELYKTSAGYGVAIEAMRARKVDIATFGPFGYLVASAKADAEVIVVRGRPDTGISDYRGTIVVAANSPYRTIDDLLAHSVDVSFAFVDPASTSGYLAQYAFFQSRGTDPETAFKKTMFAVTHVASAMAVVAGKVDAAAVMERTLTTLMDGGHMRSDGVRVLWTSPAMPASPIAVRRDLPESFKRELQQALVSIPERDPELWAMWPNVKGGDGQGLMKGDDTMFAGIRAMAANVERLGRLEK